MPSRGQRYRKAAPGSDGWREEFRLAEQRLGVGGCVVVEGFVGEKKDFEVDTLGNQ